LNVSTNAPAGGVVTNPASARLATVPITAIASMTRLSDFYRSR
jgi:hypothetical protein